MCLCHKNLHQYPGLELITICQRIDYIYRIGGSPIGISLFVSVANGKGQSRMNNPDTKMDTKHRMKTKQKTQHQPTVCERRRLWRARRSGTQVPMKGMKVLNVGAYEGYEGLERRCLWRVRRSWTQVPMKGKKVLNAGAYEGQEGLERRCLWRVWRSWT